jgi:hypothetical protein
MTISKITKEQTWSEWEVESLKLGDKRLNTRLSKCCDQSTNLSVSQVGIAMLIKSHWSNQWLTTFLVIKLQTTS